MKICQRTKKENKSKESPIILELIKEFFGALKKDKLFDKLLLNSTPITPFLTRENDFKLALSYHQNILECRRSVNIPVDSDITYRAYLPKKTKFCGSLMSKLDVLLLMLTHSERTIKQYIPQFVSSYVRFYCKKNNIKIYPNPMIFAMWFGCFFMIMGFLLILAFLWGVIGIDATIIYISIVFGAVLYGYLMCW